MDKKESNSDFYAIMAAIVCHIFWGFSFMAARTALNTAHVFILLSHRFLLAFLVMSLLVLFRAAKLHINRKGVWLLVLMGVAEPVVYFLGEQFGILHTSTVFSGVMIAMIPIVSTLVASPILGEKPTASQLLFSALSVGGVIGIGLISNSSGAIEPIGVAALFVAVFSACAYTMLSRRLSTEYSAFERSYMMMADGAAAFTVLALIHCRADMSEYFRPLSVNSYLIALLFLGLGCSVISFFLSSYALTRLPVARATVFANLTTVVSVFAGAFFLHEPFSWFGVLCCAMILIGIYGVQRSSHKEA